MEKLVERGYRVVALAKDPDKAREAFGRPPKDGPLTVAMADVTDAGALEAPMRGCVACVSCVYVGFRCESVCGGGVGCVYTRHSSISCKPKPPTSPT